MVLICMQCGLSIASGCVRNRGIWDCGLVGVNKRVGVCVLMRSMIIGVFGMGCSVAKAVVM